MTTAEPLAEIWRGDFLESVHSGHAVICDETGEITEAWGDPGQVILPRSSCKMIQALPLVESGAADAAGLGPEQLALACASHQGGAIHTARIAHWLAALGLGEADLRCGGHMPRDEEAHRALYCGCRNPDQTHNNCSGKHTGFLTLNRHLRADSEYIDPAHPVQKAVREAFEAVTGAPSPGHAIDGCSAPNFATTLHGLARAMAFFASADGKAGTRAKAALRLRDAMVSHPDLVAGEGRACTELMRAMEGRVAVKTGAEGVFVAIIPQKRLGVALKISDGATRASECAIAAILVRLGVLDPKHPATQKRMAAPLVNCRGIKAARIQPAPSLVRL